MPTDFVSDYEEVTGQSREDAFAEAAPVETKVIAAPETPEVQSSGVEVETA